MAASVEEDPLYVDMKGSFKADENTAILSFKWLNPSENIIMNIIFHFCQ